MNNNTNQTKGKSLFKNTVFLYILTFSNYFFGLITLPYETRVLGPEAFGVLGFAAAFYTYFYIIFDFGFILCGTKKIAELSGDVKSQEKVLSGIITAKLLLFISTALLFVIICSFVDQLKNYSTILLLYLIYAGVTCLIPDYLYRGIENMKMITYRTVLVRFIFTCLIFIFLRHPEQVYLIPLFNIIGTVCALIWIFYDIKHNLRMSIKFVPISYAFTLLKESFLYFTSRIASTIYSATNLVILGFIYPGSNVLGYYTSVDKVRSLAAQAASPVADSFYPYMIRTKDYKKLFKISVILESLIILACVVLWIYSKEFCMLIFGSEYIDAYKLLRYSIPLIAIILPNYMLGFPSLSPMGMAKWANYSVICAMCSQLIGLILLFSIGNINPYSILVITLISELVCLLVRAYALALGHKRHKYVLNITQ